MGRPEQGAIDRVLARIGEGRDVAESVKRHKWAAKTNREKAEALIASVDPTFVRESDLPKIALAQVHATLALKHYG